MLELCPCICRLSCPNRREDQSLKTIQTGMKIEHRIICYPASWSGLTCVVELCRINPRPPNDSDILVTESRFTLGNVTNYLPCNSPL